MNEPVCKPVYRVAYLKNRGTFIRGGGGGGVRLLGIQYVSVRN